MALTKVSYSMIQGASVNITDYGAVGDGTTDDSAAIQSAIDSGAKSIIIPPGTFLAQGLTVDNDDVTFIGQGGTLKHYTTNVLQNSRTWRVWNNTGTGTQVTTGVEWTVKVTGNNVNFVDVKIDGNAVPYASSAGYPNTEVHILWYNGVESGSVRNCNIQNFNGNGIYVYDSANVLIDGNTILYGVGLTGSLTSMEQVLISSSEQCTVSNNDIGGFCSWSAISTVGGRRAVTASSDLGGFLPYNSGKTVYNSYTDMGYAVGASDGNHMILNNVCRSDVTSASEAGGGGILGRVITVNSGCCLISGNTVYDTTSLSQGGIGLGHSYVGASGEGVFSDYAAHSIVTNNLVFGFDKSGQGYGIINNSSYDVQVAENHVYNCNVGVSHDRYATSAMYQNNHFEWLGVAIEIIPSKPNANAIGTAVLKIDGNYFNNNDLDIKGDVSLGSGYSDYYITNNTIESFATTGNIIDVSHGRLFFQNNQIVSTTADKTARFYAYGTTNVPEVVVVGNTFQENGTAGLAIHFDGDVTYTRGPTRFNENVVRRDGTSTDRYVRMQRQTDDVQILNNRFRNSYFQIDSTHKGFVAQNNTFESSVSAAILFDGTNGTETVIQISNNVIKSIGAATAFSCGTAYQSMFVVTNNTVNADIPIINAARVSNANANAVVTGNYKVSASTLVSADV